MVAGLAVSGATVFTVLRDHRATLQPLLNELTHDDADDVKGE